VSNNSSRDGEDEEDYEDDFESDSDDTFAIYSGDSESEFEHAISFSGPLAHTMLVSDSSDETSIIDDSMESTNSMRMQTEDQSFKKDQTKDVGRSNNILSAAQVPVPRNSKLNTKS
jgi:hypothetical protein